MMNELKKYILPIKDFWIKLSAKAKKIILASFAGLVLLCVLLGLWLNRTQYALLYSGLDHDEAVEVMTELKDSGVDYREENDSIYIPAAQEDSMRMQLANEGHPKTAPNYDFFTNNVDVMTTDYEKKVIEKYQLNQRLEDVINTLDPIENAYVTISIPDEGDYAWDDDKSAPSASVALKLRSGQTLDAKQVNGIKQLVSKSVPNLEPDHVSVIDNSTGEELQSADSDASGSVQMDLTEFKLKVEKQYEDSLQNKILNHLEGLYGKGNISVSVKSQMNLDKTIKNVLTYQPTTDDGKGVVSESEEQHEETREGDDSEEGTPGAETNTETYPGVTVDGNVITTKDNNTYKYLVSQVQEQIQGDAAALDDVTVSVIVNDSGMTDTEVENLKSAVAFASGVSADKVNVLSKDFYNPDQPVTAEPAGNALPFDWRILLAGGGVFLLLIILTVVLLARHRKKRAKQLEEKLMLAGDADNPDVLSQAGITDVPTESIEQIRQSTGGKEEKIRKDLQEFSAQNPEIAAQLIRSWLKGEDENG